MADTEIQAPAFVQLLASDLTDNGNVVLQFLGEDDQRYRVEIAKRIVGAVVMNVIGQKNKSRPAMLDDARRQSDPLMSLRLRALRPMLTSEGKPSLAMVLAGGLEVGLELEREAIPALKNTLDKLEDLTAPPSDAPKH